MTIALLFWILMLVCCGYAAVFGGWEGRCFAFLYLAQSLLAAIAINLNRDWSAVHWATFAIDMGLFAGFLFLVIRTQRFWPVWVLGFHFITISAHVASLFANSVPMKTYFLLATMWAVPKLIIAAVGVHLDHRAGLPPLSRLQRRVADDGLPGSRTAPFAMEVLRAWAAVRRS